MDLAEVRYPLDAFHTYGCRGSTATCFCGFSVEGVGSGGLELRAYCSLTVKTYFSVGDQKNPLQDTWHERRLNAPTHRSKNFAGVLELQSTLHTAADAETLNPKP